MSADKYNAFLLSDTYNKNSIFALTIKHVTAENISGEIYYFNKKDSPNKKINILSEFNNEAKKIHIIVYNGRNLAYYKPPEGKEINDIELLDKLNSYDKCIIINIKFKEYKNTYIFLREQDKQNTEGIFEEMKKENKATFEKYNLINIVKALFNLIEDYYINLDDISKEEPAAAATSHQDVGGGSGKRKYKANVNQKSLKKMSTIIKKLLKINLNIKPATKPKAKPATKPKAKPVAKPTAKPATKPKAKPATKPKAKPATKPKAKPATKPKTKKKI